MITNSQMSTLRVLASDHGVILTEVEMFSLTSREAARIIRRLRAA